MSNFFSSLSSILITGGTGSFGRAFLSKILSECKNFERIVIFSRDELKQWELQQIYPKNIYPQLRFFLGDIRDKNRLELALENVDAVVHSAALKQVPFAEYNPMEFIKTNVIGSENLVQACLNSNVKRLVALSTDKASSPINLYGATKLCSDKLFIAANNIIGSRDLQFSVVRYGNVMGSRGSVIPLFMKLKKTGTIPITDKEMTRFNISLDEGVKLVISAFNESLGGEIYVPKLPSYRLIDVAEAIAPDCKIKIIGKRIGEKIHEEMISTHESSSTLDLGSHFVILQQDKLTDYLKAKPKAKIVKPGFSYNSKNNDNFINVEQIRELIKLNMNSEFQSY